MKQTSFLPKVEKSCTEHGHGCHKGKRKLERPFSPKLPLHVVFRSSKARGNYSLLSDKNRKIVDLLLDRYARRYRIKVYRFQNVGNHLHLLIQTKMKDRDSARKDLNAFLRRFSGELAMRITGGKKGSAFGRFWDELVYSRVVTWGREFTALKAYFIKNLFEAHGLWNRKKNPDWRLITIEADTG